MFDFDLLTPAKKISLCASAAVAYLMLTAFVASLTESAANIEWACWLGYYSILGYGVMLVAGGLDLRTNYKDMCRVATCVFALAGVVGLVSATQLFPMIMFILAFITSAGVVVLDSLNEQKINILYSIICLAFLMLMIFWILIVAGSTKATVVLMAFDFPTAIFAIAAGYNCYLILKD